MALLQKEAPMLYQHYYGTSTKGQAGRATFQHSGGFGYFSEESSRPHIQTFGNATRQDESQYPQSEEHGRCHGGQASPFKKSEDDGQSLGHRNHDGTTSLGKRKGGRHEQEVKRRRLSSQLKSTGPAWFRR